MSTERALSPSAHVPIYDDDLSPADAEVILVPVPFDGTCTYGLGAADGPAAIAQASDQVDWYDLESGHGRRPHVSMLAIPADIRERSDATRKLARQVTQGDLDEKALQKALAAIDAHCSAVNEHVLAEVTRWHRAGRHVGVVGGDHGSIFGSIAAAAARHPGLGVLHIDAHADLRKAYLGMTWSHASIMYNVMERLPGVSRLVQVGVRDFCEEEVEVIVESGGRISTHFDEGLARQRLEGVSWGQQVARIIAELPENIYVSLDIDGLDPALCPHTGTPVPGGLSWHELIYLLTELRRSERRLVGFDLAEVAPGSRGDEWDANVGARVLFKLVCWAASQGV